MSYASEHSEQCIEPGCTASVPASKWSRFRAQEAGWFFQVDGTIWCPEHVPAWVSGWRETRGVVPGRRRWQGD